MGLKTEEDIKFGFTNINTQQLFHPERLANIKTPRKVHLIFPLNYDAN